jgi:eukaryotic-like serine/threonine-protein kinase
MWTERQTIDFLREALERLTSQDLGTSGYMPNDIYALGITAIQALTGRNPNELLCDPVTCELIWNYATPDRPAVRVSDGLRDILTKMVRYHFKDRYQSVADILHDLDSI